MTPVLIGKSLVLGGWPSKIGFIWNNNNISWKTAPRIRGICFQQRLWPFFIFQSCPNPATLQTVEMLGNTGLPTGLPPRRSRMPWVFWWNIERVQARHCRRNSATKKTRRSQWVSLLLFIAERTNNQKANGLLFLWVAEFFCWGE